MNKFLSENESYLIGFVQGDGNIYEQTRNRGKMSIEVSKRDADMPLKLKQIIQSMFQCNVTISERTRDTNFKKNHTSIRLSVCDIRYYNQTVMLLKQHPNLLFWTALNTSKFDDLEVFDVQ